MNMICEILTTVIKTVICEINGCKLQVSEDGRIFRINKKGDLLIIENKPNNGCGYNQISCKNKMIYRHRIIAMCFLGLDINNKGLQIDHINGVKYDNYLTNLRVVTHQQNQHNHVNAKGYCFCKKTKKYKAQIKLNNKTIYLGLFNTKEEAHNAYLNAKPKYHKID